MSNQSFTSLWGISNRTYDRIKFVALIALPAIGTAYFSFGELLGWPYGAEVVGSITIIDTFLGVVLGFASSRYQGAQPHGEIKINTDDPEKDLYRLVVSTPLEDLAPGQTVTFNVVSDDSQ